MLIVNITNIEEKCPAKKIYCITLLFYSSLLAVIIFDYNKKHIKKQYSTELYNNSGECLKSKLNIRFVKCSLDDSGVTDHHCRSSFSFQLHCTVFI